MTTRPILVVEDNPDDAALTKRAFRNSRLANRLIHVHDGAEALDFIFATGQYAGRDETDNPSLILLDLKLPKVDGLEVLRRIRTDQRTASLPVVILTVSDDEQDLVKGYELGVNSFIRKPIDSRQFHEAVEQLGLYWLVLNESPPESRG